MQGVLLWTISDLPLYEMLAGWSVKEVRACPYCHNEISCKSLCFCDSTAYKGHQRFLPIDRRCRLMKGPFDGMEELRQALSAPSDFEVYNQMNIWT